MQANTDANPRGSDFYVYQQAPRLLEDPSSPGGWIFGTELNNGGQKVLARVEGLLSEQFSISMKAGSLRGTAYFIRRLCWTHTSALLFSEGGAVQTLIGPNYLFVAGDRSAAYDPRPHLEGVLLVAVHEAPPNTSLLDVFSELRIKFC